MNTHRPPTRAIGARGQPITLPVLDQDDIRIQRLLLTKERRRRAFRVLAVVTALAALFRLFKRERKSHGRSNPAGNRR